MKMTNLPTDSGWWGNGQILNLEQHVNVGSELDPLTVCQTEHLVVVENRVHVFNPQGINRSIANDPLMGLRCVLQPDHTRNYSSRMSNKVRTLKYYIKKYTRSSKRQITWD